MLSWCICNTDIASRLSEMIYNSGLLSISYGCGVSFSQIINVMQMLYFELKKESYHQERSSSNKLLLSILNAGKYIVIGYHKITITSFHQDVLLTFHFSTV